MEYTLHVTDEDKHILRMLAYISWLSQRGHSFDVVIDPDMQQFKATFPIDGDGADKIHRIYTGDKECILERIPDGLKIHFVKAEGWRC